MRVLGTEPRTYGRAASALKPRRHFSSPWVSQALLRVEVEMVLQHKPAARPSACHAGGRVCGHQYSLMYIHFLAEILYLGVRPATVQCVWVSVTGLLRAV